MRRMKLRAEATRKAPPLQEVQTGVLLFPFHPYSRRQSCLKIKRDLGRLSKENGRTKARFMKKFLSGYVASRSNPMMRLLGPQVMKDPPRNYHHYLGRRLFQQVLLLLRVLPPTKRPTLRTSPTFHHQRERTWISMRRILKNRIW